MPVCKMFKAALPEVLTSASLTSQASLAFLSGIQARFSNLLVLEIRRDMSQITSHLQKRSDLSSLFFPNLRELIITNDVADRLVFDEVHYPQLRKLIVDGRSPADDMCECENCFDRKRVQMALYGFRELTLHLPHLLTIELEGIFVQSFHMLCACLSVIACPRLRRVRIVSINFEVEDDGPQEMLLDIPWLEFFELERVKFTALRIRAPRLTELILKHCWDLKYIVLLPDGQPPVQDNKADDADVAVVLPVSEYTNGLSAALSMIAPLARVDLAEGETAVCLGARTDLSLQRIYMEFSYLYAWEGTETYDQLMSDVRIREFYDRDEYAAASDWWMSSDDSDEDYSPSLEEELVLMQASGPSDYQSFDVCKLKKSDRRQKSTQRNKSLHNSDSKKRVERAKHNKGNTKSHNSEEARWKVGGRKLGRNGKNTRALAPISNDYVCKVT